MGSFEIVEEKDVVKQDSIEYEIDKLFQSITIKSLHKGEMDSLETTSTSAGPSRITSPLNKCALRKSFPARSPRVGPSDSVSLKQALRDLCISKASEMAAQKRFSKSAAASPRTSEAGRIKSLYTHVLSESSSPGRSEIPVDNKGKQSLIELSLTPMDDIPSSSHSVPERLDEIATSSHMVIEDELIEIDKHITSLPSCSSSKVDAEELDKSIVSLARLKSEPTALDSAKLDIEPSSRTEKSKLVSKLRRNIPRPKKKIVVKKKLKIVVATKLVEKVDISVEPSSSELLCQRCHCTVKNTESLTRLQEAKIDSCEVSQSSKANIIMKQDEFSLSSKDSLGDYSRSSTSMTEESNLSRFSCNNKPHMSMDVRWEAIKHVKLQYGSLGLKHFNLLKKLGCGDIGTVYLAELVSTTNCVFAIKVMDNEFLARRKKTPRAHAERTILKMLDHPFLPTLYAQFTSDNLSCLVMEYCPGGDLHVLRQKQINRCFPEPAARFYVAEVLLALEYLHMLGVIYRDLKPENILVREDGHIMLTDFDLSLRCEVNPTLLKSDQARMSGPFNNNNTSNCIQPLCIEPSCRVPCFTRKPKRPDLLMQQFKSLPQLVAEPTEARSNSFVGTHEYLAPEIIKGEGHGAAVDWWTFGVLLYELLYGKTPFKGYNNEETLSNVLFQSLKFPDSPLVGFQAKELIRRLLVKDPVNRLGSEKGAAEIKRHPFFDGLNWALIRCAIPPELPDVYENVVVAEAASPEGSNGYLECKAIGDHLEFELF